jgi:hypothetical protein
LNRLQSKQARAGSEASAGRRAFAQNVVVVQFEVPPKALANFSPALELATTLGHTREKEIQTLKALARSRSRTLSALGRSAP